MTGDGNKVCIEVMEVLANNSTIGSKIKMCDTPFRFTIFMDKYITDICEYIQSMLTRDIYVSILLYETSAILMPENWNDLQQMLDYIQTVWVWKVLITKEVVFDKENGMNNYTFSINGEKLKQLANFLYLCKRWE